MNFEQRFLAQDWGLPDVVLVIAINLREQV